MSYLDVLGMGSKLPLLSSSYDSACEIVRKGIQKGKISEEAANIFTSIMNKEQATFQRMKKLLIVMESNECSEKIQKSLHELYTDMKQADKDLLQLYKETLEIHA